MIPVEDLETPAVLVDLDVLERNIARQAARARETGIKLRPHAKTHKLPEVGQMQLAAGAAGIALAKTGEAQVFADAGFDDIFLAYPLRVMLKVDSGLHRVGVDPVNALEAARGIAELPGIELIGVFTHAGQAYQAETPDAVAAVGRHEGETVARVAQELRGAGLPIREVSVGSTPTAPHAMRVPGVTECRPGNYVYNDASQVRLAVCTLEDCAMTVLATVVSAPAADRAVLDAGSKTLSSDPLRPRPGGHGFVLGKESRIARLSEEHGVVEVVAGESFHVGERVRVLPNHACVVSNLHDRVVAVRGGRVEAVWTVAARGRVT
jgi:D-serine deaminase-like pyridoxal phosphate-dependent protein